MHIIFFFPLFTKSLSCIDAEPKDMICSIDYSCTFNTIFTSNCEVFPRVTCTGPRTFSKNISCIYCYQLPFKSIDCEPATNCVPSLEYTQAYCKPLLPCMGNSLFLRNSFCQKTSKSIRTAILLSLFLGGFGADRFYLGYYLIGAFKFITLGGFGLGYMIDLFLIFFGYLGPSDNSLYPERF